MDYITGAFSLRPSQTCDEAGAAEVGHTQSTGDTSATSPVLPLSSASGAALDAEAARGSQALPYSCPSSLVMHLPLARLSASSVSDMMLECRLALSLLHAPTAGHLSNTRWASRATARLGRALPISTPVEVCHRALLWSSSLLSG